ncbi:MAG: FMN-binding protein [Alphaproteobacteria bacterium HGW-Alphaproteobacteria-3]|nr:MAG: FMN-binding protein [Alphaproteobacteria bacterium HGW-Alphaproteobacteria-3]
MRRQTGWIAGLGLALVLALGPADSRAADVYQEPAAFLGEVFQGEAPDASVLWLTEDVKRATREVLGHDLKGLRLRYWRRDNRTAWILEEIGKTKPITTGIAVSDGAIERLQVLIYRESHGWEVRHSFFTDQFKGLTLDDDARLSEQIDGISGATLSVRALEKLARLALCLDAHVRAAETGAGACNG